MGSLISTNNDKDFDNVKSKYFSSIDQLIKQHYENNISEKRLRANISICFENKYFDEICSTEETLNQSYIYWLQYLYDYLSLDLRDKEWAREMLVLLDEEQFLSENKYLSQFFFKDFYMSSEPSCMRKSKNDITIDNDIYEEASYELRTSISNSNLGMMRALGGSIGPNAIMDDDTDNDINLSINAATDTDSKYKTFRNKVKKYIEIFKEHIVYKDHPINKVIQIFEKAWVKYIEKQILRIKNNLDTEEEKAKMNLLIDNLTRDLQNFIIKVQISLKLFYCRAINYSCFANEKDELMNLITTLFFKTGQIYKMTFELLKLKLKDEVEDMQKKYRELYNINPEQLGILKQFCLNEVTLDYQENILEIELKKAEEHLKKQNEEENLDLNSKGVANLYFSDDNLDKKKIQQLMMDIKIMKNQFPKNGNYNINSIKVDIDFDHDDNNLIPESILNKQTFVNEEGLVSSLLPKSKENFDYENDFLLNKNDLNNHPNRITCYPNKSKKYSLKENIIFNDTDNENDNENENEDVKELPNNNSNQIIRDNNINDGRKTITPLNHIKIFNRVRFTKDPNVKIRLPYETAIQLLKQIEKYKAPFEKMLIFASLGNEIKSCVDDFWKHMDGYFKTEILGVEAEQLMTIFIYIIAKAQISDILVHCRLIQLFTTSVIKSSMIGYYYSNAEASVKYIQNLKNIKELLKGNIEVFSDDKSDY